MNGIVESYQLNEGIIEDLRFGIDSSGNIVTVNEGSVEYKIDSMAEYEEESKYHLGSF
jgi:hypothetical protein